MPKESPYLGVRIEIERCIECDQHEYCTRHQTAKYDAYTNDLTKAVNGFGRDAPIETNPGPMRHGINCRRVACGNQIWNNYMWTTMFMDPNTRKWFPGQTFRYPRCGAFEVYVSKYKQRVEVFSKLKTRKWPNVQWLADKIKSVVENELGGWEEAKEEVKEKKVYTGIGGKQNVTDDELRQYIKSKFSTIVEAFRAFDKNGDGMVNKREFFAGMRNAGVDVPPDVMERIWAMADQDNSGNIHYQEFAQRFAVYKASHTLHRHADIKSGDEVNMKLHGFGHASHMATHAAIRETEDLHFGVSQDLYGTKEEAQAQEGPKTIPQLAREGWIMNIPIDDCTPDQLRARMYVKHGNLMNAFRHIDLSGDSRISFEEFLHALPKLADHGGPISHRKAAELWRAMDKDCSGVIDLTEFASDKLVSRTAVGAAMMKGQTFDPVTEGGRLTQKMKKDIVEEPTEYTTRRESIDGSQMMPTPAAASAPASMLQPAPTVPQQEEKNGGMQNRPAPTMLQQQEEPVKATGFQPAAANPNEQNPEAKKLARPESASTVATAGESLTRPGSAQTIPPERPQSAVSFKSNKSGATSGDEYESPFENSSDNVQVKEVPSDGPV